MCTYITEKMPMAGSGKGAQGWFSLSQAVVYLDHPVHAPFEHSLNIDFTDPAQGAAARVAVELDPVAARSLALGILAILDSDEVQPLLPAG